MAKVRKAFICSSCGASSPKWIGKCPHCEAWNTYQEELLQKPTAAEEKQRVWDAEASVASDTGPVPLTEVMEGNTRRLVSPEGEFNRVLGGGIVPGSIILIGGAPGIGKSTLLLQLALQMDVKVLYVSGEESAEQIKLRAGRLPGKQDNCFLFTETNVSTILKQARRLEPQLLVIDSIQTLSSPYIDSAPGGVSQVRETAAELQRFAKSTGIPVVLIGHVTKDNNLAGPRLLEHIVDVVIYFEGEQQHAYRILRTIKNRFGSTAELGIYEMRGEGLREVPNPSEFLLGQQEEELSGSAVAATLEGRRPMLIETQALVSTAVYGTPQRSATGFDLRRLHMLLAVLEKRGGLALGQYDVFLNMAGGLRVDDPAIDLAIVAALCSSFEDVAIPRHTAFAGEVGLSGEIRAVARIEPRLQEADRLGFQRMFIPQGNLKGIDPGRYRLRIEALGRIDRLRDILF